MAVGAVISCMEDPELAREFVTRTSVFLVIYAILLVFGTSLAVSFSVFALFMMANIYKSGVLRGLLNRFVATDLSSERAEIVNLVTSLRNYGAKLQQWNSRRVAMMNSLPSAHKKKAQQIGYLEKIGKVSGALTANARIVEAIGDFVVRKHDVTAAEQRVAVASSKYYRTVETLCHFQRDWSENIEEIEPILNYFKASLKRILTADRNVRPDNTVIVVPGSGLGRLAHELALENYSQVHLVEFSLMMNLFNEFIYDEQAGSAYKVYPYVHSYSHHVSLANQLRSIELKNGLKKPGNLTLHHGDFRKFSVPDLTGIDNVIIATEFFVDTAQNVFEYLDAITRIAAGKNSYWINLGPLKYGTAPKIEPNLEEWKQLRELYGWHDLEEEDPLKGDLVGYLTDKKSLWQGYYGVGRWITRHASK